MKERTKLLKKAVLTGVGATANVDRVKSALNDALNDLMKVGQDLLDELEEKGKVKADSVQSFLKNLQEDATKQAESMEKTVSTKVQTSVLKAANDFGLVTKEEFADLLARVEKLEKSEHGQIIDVATAQDDEMENSSKSTKRKANHN